MPAPTPARIDDARVEAMILSLITAGLPTAVIAHRDEPEPALSPDGDTLLIRLLGVAATPRPRNAGELIDIADLDVAVQVVVSCARAEETVYAQNQALAKVKAVLDQVAAEDAPSGHRLETFRAAAMPGSADEQVRLASGIVTVTGLVFRTAGTDLASFPA
jgi:hypothetical protein